MIPTRKVTVASVGAALAVLVAYLLNLFGVSLPGPVYAAISTVLAAAAGWAVPEDGTNPAVVAAVKKASAGQAAEMTFDPVFAGTRPGPQVTEPVESSSKKAKAKG